MCIAQSKCSDPATISGLKPLSPLWKPIYIIVIRKLMTLDGHLGFLKLREYWSTVLIWCILEQRNAGAQLLTANMQGFDQAGPVPAFSQCSLLSLQLYSSRTEFPCREKDWSSSLGLLWSHDIHLTDEAQLGSWFVFSVSLVRICASTHTHTHTLPPHTHTHPSSPPPHLSVYRISLEGP